MRARMWGLRLWPDMVCGFGLVCAAGLAGCMPEDIYTVKQQYQAHYDSVMDERTSLLEVVEDGALAARAYLDAEDAYGDPFAADGLVQTQIEMCHDLVERMQDETVPETQELLQALDKGQVVIKRFKRLFKQFDADWIEMNDCWRDLWADPTFDAWLARYSEQEECIAEWEAGVDMRISQLSRAWRGRATGWVSSRWKLVLTHDSIPLVEFEGKFRSRYSDYIRWQVSSFPAESPEWVDREFWRDHYFLQDGTVILWDRLTGARDSTELLLPRMHLVDQWAEANYPGCAR